jgi:hypothetical protein
MNGLRISAVALYAETSVKTNVILSEAKDLDDLRFNLDSRDEPLACRQVAKLRIQIGNQG